MFVCPSVCFLSGMSMHCDHTVHFSMDLSLWLAISMIWAPRRQSMFTYYQSSFSSSTWKKGHVWMCKLCEEFNSNNDKQVTWLVSPKRKRRHEIGCAVCRQSDVCLLDVADCNACHIFHHRVWYRVLSVRYACIQSSSIILTPRLSLCKISFRLWPPLLS